MPGPRPRTTGFRRTTIHWLSALALALAASQAPARGADVPTPEAHLGYRPGADGHLAGWGEVVSYFEKVDQASDRVTVRELGRSTEGRPFVAAFVSSPDAVRDLDRYRGYQAALASGEAPADAVGKSRPVVVITCSIHSTETASTLMALELLHGLATADDPATREVLDHAILILVPSVNPDGVDKVASWYEKSKGTTWEGSGMVELYHKYAGHDTNRDWFMLNLKETQLLSRLLYREWFPTFLYDVHQMGSRGARLFVPPFHDPINPNLDPRIHQGIGVIGAHMAADLAAAGKQGVLTGALYDNWWNGGNRTTPQRHNIVAVLTEAASVKMATPIWLGPDDLKGGGRGFRDHGRAVNFVDPWPGGWWRLRDIVDYELICARSLLTLAAKYGPTFQKNLLGMAAEARRQGRARPPHAWVVPSDQRDPGSALRLVQALADTGVEVLRLESPLQAAGATFPAGSWLLPADQPYRAHLKDMMERQVYPDRRTEGGRAEAPYDVAGWTLPLQMGVRTVEVVDPDVRKRADARRVGPDDLRPDGRIDGPEKAAFFTLANRANDDFRVLNALLDAGIAVRLVPDPNSTDDPLWFVSDAASRDVLAKVLPKVSSVVKAIDGPAPADNRSQKVRRQRLALYQPWEPSMDEGWTRLVLESFGFPYTTVHNADVRAGRLHDRFDVLLVPSIGPKTLTDGYGPNETDPQYVGGLGAEGAAALREFVRDGGRAVFLDASCDYAIDALELPVRNVLKGLPSSTFYAPGSILRAELSSLTRGRTAGVPREVSVYVDAPAAFETVGQPADVTTVLRYAKSHPLESGWLLGPEKLQGKAAMVSAGLGDGKVVLFGFRPQHRGQPHGTFRLLFNALAFP